MKFIEIFLVILFGIFFFSIFIQIQGSFDYDKYEKYKDFCEERGYIMEKRPDTVQPICYKIENDILEEFTIKEKEGKFYFSSVKRGVF